MVVHHQDMIYHRSDDSAGAGRHCHCEMGAQIIDMDIAWRNGHWWVVAGPAMAPLRRP